MAMPGRLSEEGLKQVAGQSTAIPGLDSQILIAEASFDGTGILRHHANISQIHEDFPRADASGLAVGLLQGHTSSRAETCTNR